MNQIPVFYDPRVSLSAEAWISLSKPGRLMSIIQQEAECQLVPFDKISQAELLTVHDEHYVDGVINGQLVNGFGSVDPAVTEQVLWANGALFSAADHVYQHGGVAFAPVSGFHHAGPAHGGGFCTFNALAIVAAQLEDFGNKTLILDFDGHFGDGTQEFFETGVLHDHLTTHLSRLHGFVNAKQAVAKALEEIAKKPDLVLYQAGADSHDNDSLGAGYFTHEQWLARDEAIFAACREHNVPLVWNLAGGYNGKETILLHYSTWRTVKQVYLRTDPPSLKNSPLIASSASGTLD